MFVSFFLHVLVIISFQLHNSNRAARKPSRDVCGRWPILDDLFGICARCASDESSISASVHETSINFMLWVFGKNNMHLTQILHTVKYYVSFTFIRMNTLASFCFRQTDWTTTLNVFRYIHLHILLLLHFVCF